MGGGRASYWSNNDGDLFRYLIWSLIRISSGEDTIMVWTKDNLKDVVREKIGAHKFLVGFRKNIVYQKTVRTS